MLSFLQHREVKRGYPVCVPGCRDPTGFVFKPEHPSANLPDHLSLATGVLGPLLTIRALASKNTQFNAMGKNATSGRGSGTGQCSSMAAQPGRKVDGTLWLVLLLRANPLECLKNSQLGHGWRGLIALLYSIKV